MAAVHDRFLESGGASPVMPPGEDACRPRLVVQPLDPGPAGAQIRAAVTQADRLGDVGGIFAVEQLGPAAGQRVRQRRQTVQYEHQQVDRRVSADAARASSHRLHGATDDCSATPVECSQSRIMAAVGRVDQAGICSGLWNTRNPLGANTVSTLAVAARVG